MLCLIFEGKVWPNGRNSDQWIETNLQYTKANYRFRHQERFHESKNPSHVKDISNCCVKQDSVRLDLTENGFVSQDWTGAREKEVER